MPNLLIVEDDEIKLRTLSVFLFDRYPGFNVKSCRSVNTAYKSISSDRPDIILLDMTLPTYDEQDFGSGGRPQGFGGWNVLRFVKALKLNSRVIVVTQFETINDQGQQMSIASLEKLFLDEFPVNFVGMVYFSPVTDWKQPLEKLLNSEGE